MTTTLLSDVQNQVQTFWSSLFMPELMETSVLPALVNKDYQGEIKAGGSTVRVSQVTRPKATRRTVGSNHDSFDSSKLITNFVDVVADQVFTAAFEFDDLVDLQSQIGQESSAIRQGLLEAMEIELNNFLYTLVAPTSVTGTVTAFNATQLLATRAVASVAKWNKVPGWYLLADPSYYNDLLAAVTMTSRDYVKDDAPVIGGQIATQRFGFNILEDNSAGMAALSPTSNTSQLALAFHPDFLHLCLQKVPTFEISSLHSQKRHGYLISVTMVGGAKLGIAGAAKHAKIYNT